VLNQNKSKMGFKWGQELLKAKAIIADLYQTIVGKDKKIEELEAEIAMLRDFQGDLNADIEELKEENVNLKCDRARFDQMMDVLVKHYDERLKESSP
jgi:predicted nuclease with TOPRIM domain